ncbi:MAG: AAA family ATPase [Thiolinea sp.]
MIKSITVTNRTTSMSQKRKKLPIGIQTFREIREENYYYVDKTIGP